MTTGIIQLILAIVASILSGVAIYLAAHYNSYSGPVGLPIGATIFVSRSNTIAKNFKKSIQAHFHALFYL